jgi:hypothetical protein
MVSIIYQPYKKLFSSIFPLTFSLSSWHFIPLEEFNLYLLSRALKL